MIISFEPQVVKFGQILVQLSINIFDFILARV